jgi:hypothetical protein
MVTATSMPLFAARLLLGATFLAFFALPALAGPRGEEDAAFAPAAKPFSPPAVAGHTSYTAVRGPRGHQEITANFLSFSGDPLSIRFALTAAASEESFREFGVTTEELDALMEQCRASKGCDQERYDRYTTRYYHAQGMRLIRRSGEAMPRLHVDVAKAVERNRQRVRPVALALRRLAEENGRDREWMMEAAIALVQSGLVYRQPETWEDGRKILGFYPPPRALERGYGDCDTKSALLAAILQNLSNDALVGVHVPRHYLLGIARVPRADQSFIQYGGRPYVLVEASGPARRPPGEVSQTTETALASGDGIRIDPMF